MCATSPALDGQLVSILRGETPDAPARITGLVGDGVTSVQITTFDGSTQTVKPQENVYSATLSSAARALDVTAGKVSR